MGDTGNEELDALEIRAGSDRDALPGGESGRRLAELLDLACWRPESLAARLNDYAALQGRSERLHPKTPYKWLAGAQPRSPWPTFVTCLLSEHLGRPVTAGQLGWSLLSVEPVPASEGLVLPWTVEGGLQAALAVADAGDMQRRLFLTLLGAAVTAPAHEWLLAQAAGDASRQTGRDLPDDVIDYLSDLTATLRRIDDQLGGGQLLALVNQHSMAVIHLLKERRYTDGAGRRLHATSGELLRLAGWLAFDAGHHAPAQRYWIAALHEAHAAGDRGLGANTLGFMSCQAKDLGQHRQAVTLAETARAGYPGAAPRVQAILALRAAEAYANDHDVVRCRRALDDAFDQLTRTPPQHGDPDWAYWLDTTHAHGQAGYCYLRLADWERARTHFAEALRGQGATITREGALRQTLMATTYVRQAHPDLDGALQLGNTAVAVLHGQVHSPRVVGHVQRLVQHLQPYRRNPDVRTITESARTLTAA